MEEGVAYSGGEDFKGFWDGECEEEGEEECGGCIAVDRSHARMVNEGGGRNWHVCQAAVETVLRSGTLNPMLELLDLDAPTADDAFEGEVTYIHKWMLRDPNPNFRLPSKSVSGAKRKIVVDELGGVHHHDNVFGERHQSQSYPANNTKPCNGAPDIFTSLTALDIGHFCTSLSAILSTGTFVSTLVVGFVAIYLTPLVNNVFFYLTVVFFLFYICLTYDVCPRKQPTLTTVLIDCTHKQYLVTSA
ncbi:hypothetical protein Fmac_029873 [Flemingia macrophylla]|uniref:Uncharacterized protein n=1 Tax=Flemingia macrophylla TaxID=520843 RepID=A0ABD1LBL3_9FABA